ncbi:hypothetical protein Mtc_0428 [Methanocella conradii HZ254]|uniref:Uncharacterized protein n=1 Tax=Methanocella conradii (strain DSM 24694 / JCM 17849 / CGMCC 1.5162 / HZ254) TaxID=1041930 RepID=H8I456_METCZ|nr:hypothetical protein [Methanocella conradii]AFC99195.1 hypothetical protein Mtc_0428 [Methanocella conradii HZ254]MDI6897805.1 hypothetical protein [Methanocella conradii]
MITVGLSEKAIGLIDSRRGSRSRDDYVNMILENILDMIMKQQAYVGGVNLMEVLEAPIAKSSPGSGIVSELIKQMKSTYSGKIPYNLFYQECMERGIPKEEIEAAVQKNKGLFQFQMSKDDEYANILLVIIYNYLKDFYSRSMSTSQFYGKCLEECLTVDDIRYAENVWQVTIPSVTTLRDLATKTDAMSIENKLLKLLYAIKKEYPETIPVAVLHNKCVQAGLTKDDVAELEKIYTRYLLTKHNEKVSTDKGVVKDKARVKAINAKIKRILDELAGVYGENIPATAFSDKCKESGFTGEEQLYAKKVFEDYQVSLASFKEIKYMNNKAYIILTSLRKLYPGKIPYNVFYTKCKAIGLKNDEIAEAIKQAGRIIASEKSDEEHYLKVLDDILSEYKK